MENPDQPYWACRVTGREQDGRAWPQLKKCLISPSSKKSCKGPLQVPLSTLSHSSAHFSHCRTQSGTVLGSRWNRLEAVRRVPICRQPAGTMGSVRALPRCLWIQRVEDFTSTVTPQKFSYILYFQLGNLSHPQQLPQTSFEGLQCVFCKDEPPHTLLQPAKAEVQKQRNLHHSQLVFHSAGGNKHVLTDPHVLTALASKGQDVIKVQQMVQAMEGSRRHLHTT